MVKWLKHCVYEQHGLSSKPTCTILLCPWERHFIALSPAWWSQQAVLNNSHISVTIQADSNILASLEAGWVNCLLYIAAPLLLIYSTLCCSCKSKDKYRDKINS